MRVKHEGFYNIVVILSDSTDIAEPLKYDGGEMRSHMKKMCSYFEQLQVVMVSW